MFTLTQMTKMLQKMQKYMYSANINLGKAYNYGFKRTL